MEADELGVFYLGSLNVLGGASKPQQDVPQEEDFNDQIMEAWDDVTGQALDPIEVKRDVALSHPLTTDSKLDRGNHGAELGTLDRPVNQRHTLYFAVARLL